MWKKESLPLSLSLFFLNKYMEQPHWKEWGEKKLTLEVLEMSEIYKTKGTKELYINTAL